jgi:hypothetical protein
VLAAGALIAAAFPFGKRADAPVPAQAAIATAA